MRACTSALVLAWPIFVVRLTYAAEPERDGMHVELGTRVGLALPVGAIEAGSRESDLMYGATPMALDVGYVASRYVSLGGFAAYAPTVPKLCASTPDCVASVTGTSTTVAEAGRAIHAMDRLACVACSFRTSSAERIVTWR